ncbi:MAG: flagellar hook-length control protein FliK [Geminicoccaceae bacterium]
MSAIAPSNPATGMPSTGSEGSRSADDPFLALLAGMLATVASPGVAATLPAQLGDATKAAETIPLASEPALPATGALLSAEAAAAREAVSGEIAPGAPESTGQSVGLAPTATAAPNLASESQADVTIVQGMAPRPEPRRGPVMVEHRPAHHRPLAVPTPTLAAAGDGPCLAQAIPAGIAQGDAAAGADLSPVAAEDTAETLDAPPHLNDTPPPPDPVGTRGRAATGDVPPLAETMRLSPPVLLAIPDHRGRQVTARLAIGAAGGASSVRIELEPADLGRVEVALHLGDAGTATASFTVDRPETLQLLQRDARTVTDMLAAAGFTVDSGSLGFSLRDGGGNAGQPGSPSTGRGVSDDARPAPEMDPAPRPMLQRGLLDLQV